MAMMKRCFLDEHVVEFLSKLRSTLWAYGTCSEVKVVAEESLYLNVDHDKWLGTFMFLTCVGELVETRASQENLVDGLQSESSESIVCAILSENWNFVGLGLELLRHPSDTRNYNTVPTVKSVRFLFHIYGRRGCSYHWRCIITSGFYLFRVYLKCSHRKPK